MNDSELETVLLAMKRMLVTLCADAQMMRHRMLDSQHGVKSHAYDVEKGGARYEDVIMPTLSGMQVPFKVPVPGNDPTGELASGGIPDPAAIGLDIMFRDLKAAHRALANVMGLHDQWTPRHGITAASDGPGLDWCRSCWRDSQHCEPVTLRPDGIPFYTGLCRWCGSFKANEGFEPPLPVLQARHRGERVTAGMVDRYRPRRAG